MAEQQYADATGATGTAPAPARDDQVQAALDELAHKVAASESGLSPNELKHRLNRLLFPSILLIFVALYVTSLAAGVEPEFGLLQAGGVSVVLAVLGRAAVGILGDETRLVLNDAQIVAMARSGAVRQYLAQSGADADDPNEPGAAYGAGAGGKE